MVLNEDDQRKFQLQIGKRLKALRKAKGYTSYEKFAVQNDISRMQYWRYEKGEDMRLSSLKKIVTALDMTMEEFFAEGFD
ncbi:MAG: helix-turn-helix transcriptional regulator [Cyclobacteriaceae bacterium]